MVATGLAIVLVALALVTRNERPVTARIERSLNAILGKAGGLVALVVGIVVTIAVQSSSITTSILIPLSAAGVLTLRNAYPVTLGANVGTTITALLAALAASSPDSLTVALRAHTTFNIIGILSLYTLCRSLETFQCRSNCNGRNRCTQTSPSGLLRRRTVHCCTSSWCSYPSITGSYIWFFHFPSR